MLGERERSIYLTGVGELSPGTVFAGHRIESVAGRGGMGVVYRATQLGLDRTVALKVIAPGLLEDQTVRQRFVRESKIAASIDHPNVIPIYYSGEEKGIAYIAMRYVAGDDIRSLVRREHRLAPERAARIIAQTANALDAAHAAGLVHRDIKPANVLLGPEDHAYLTDFGLTKHVLSVAGQTKPGHWVGTLDYVAPEQIRGDRVDARADVYALGCLLFYTLTGTVPFDREGDEAKLWAHLSEPPPKPSEYADVPEALDEVVARALAKDPDERYPSAGDLGRAAVAAARGTQPAERERLVAKGAAAPIESETVSAARPAPVEVTQADDAETVRQERSRIQRSRRPALLIGALLAAAAAGVIAAVALGVGDDNKAPPAAPSITPQPKPPVATVAQIKAVGETEVGERPNVVRLAGPNVFVGSFRSSRLAIVSAASGKVRSARPNVGIGVNGAAEGFGALWLAVSRARRVVRLDPRSGRVSKRWTMPQPPGSIAVGGGALWVGLVPGNDQPDILAKVDPRSGQILATIPVPYGIISLTTSPGAVWVLNRRRARIQRVDPKTGQIVRTVQVGGTHGEDVEYRNGALWIATPNDDTVYKVMTATGAIIPISVGKHPRQLTLGNGVVYVTNYNSSDLYTIDERSSRVVGDPVRLPVNPFSLSAGKGTLWVGSQPENKLTKLLTGRGG